MPTTEAEPEAGLISRRLALRPVADRDLPFIVELGGAREVAEMTLTMPHPMTEAAARAWIEGRTGPGERVFAIERRGDGEFIGVIGLHALSDRPEAGLGYWVGRPYWGRGYATEAVGRLVRHAFEFLGIERIEAEVFPDNEASVRVLEKTGFIVDREESRTAAARGGDRAVIVFRLLRGDYWGRPGDAAPP